MPCSNTSMLLLINRMKQYPKDRIKELTELIAAMKARDEAYKKSIAAADKLFDDAIL